MADDAKSPKPSIPRQPSTSSKTATPASQAQDIEKAPIAMDGPDPYDLRAGIKPHAELKSLRRRKGGKKLVEYYERQNQLVTDFLKPMDQHTSEALEHEGAVRLPVKIAVLSSLFSNVALAALQLYAAISSGSLALLATSVDAVFDPGSNLVLFWLHRKKQALDEKKWPVGGNRLETIGNICYGFLMGAVNLVVIVESVRKLVTHDPDGEGNSLHISSIVAVAVALGVKFALFLYCYSLKSSSSQVRVLWEDHRNDLFINSFGILTAAGGSKLAWFIDPMGAILIAIGVMLAWTKTVYGEFELLAGKSATPEFLHLIIYKALTFSDEIVGIDTVRAYHSGPEYFVEVDVVMAADTPLWMAHDVSQQLQDKIEMLPHVERAFVHVDHETTHTPEHRPDRKEIKEKDKDSR